MAEGWARHFHGDEYNFFSAGTTTHGLNPRAVTVMAEADVDISGHSSKTLESLKGTKLDIIFTVCSGAHETCPVVPGSKVQHQGFDDPPYLTKDFTDESETLNVYRRVRDEIRDFAQNIEKHLP